MKIAHKIYTADMRLSKSGYEFIKQFEPEPVNDEQLKGRLVGVENALNKLMRVPITQGQFDALVSFAYSITVEAFKGSTLLGLVNTRNHEAAAHKFSNWVRRGGIEDPQLALRRKAERELFCKERFMGRP